MKYFSLYLLPLFLVFNQDSAPQVTNPVGSEEFTSIYKDFLLDNLEETKEHLEDVLNELTEEQLRFKPANDRWSIAQCMEHIILTEESLFLMTKEAMAKEATPERKSEVKTPDAAIFNGLQDRSQKYQASPELQPTGIYTDSETAIDAFEAQREEILDFIKNISEEELRNHISDSPFGPIDSYQSLLFIAGHTARHTKQIEEVMADPAFPVR